MCRLGLAKRSILRYFATLREYGYDVQLNDDGIYRLQSYVPEQARDEQSILFTHEEAVLLSRLIENLDDTNQLKPSLQGKLASVFYHATVAPYIQRPWNAKNVEVLSVAMTEHKQVYMNGYECSYKGSNKDYVLEPYQMNVNCVDLWGYDVEDGRCKVFKLSRIGEVVLLQQPWQFEERHLKKTYDVFHIAGDEPWEHVRLQMLLKAKNLLVEEYPQTMNEVWFADGFWYWEGDVYGVMGVGRFVLGMADAVDVAQGEKLRAWLAQRGVEIGKKFSVS